jgi:thioredoxin reductase (NADPH)
VDTANSNRYSARALLLAPGSHYRRLKVSGKSSYIGAGIHFCATYDGRFYKGRHMTIVGGSSAAEESLFLVRFVEG